MILTLYKNISVDEIPEIEMELDIGKDDEAIYSYIKEYAKWCIEWSMGILKCQTFMRNYRDL